MLHNLETAREIVLDAAAVTGLKLGFFEKIKLVAAVTKIYESGYALETFHYSDSHDTAPSKKAVREVLAAAGYAVTEDSGRQLDRVIDHLWASHRIAVTA